MEQNAHINLEEIFPDTPEQMQPDEFDVEAWKEKKKEQREALYASADEMADQVLDDPETLQKFLNMQSNVRMGVTNTLLVLQQAPSATHVRTAEEWERLGRNIGKGQGKNAILLFQAAGEYAREDGTMGNGYNVGRFFDVSQTYGKPLHRRQHPEIRALIRALGNGTEVRILPSDAITPEQGALYDAQKHEIQVAKGLQNGPLFHSIARELARVQLGGHFSEHNSFFATCAANVAGKRFGIVPVEIKTIPEEIRQMKPREKREILDYVRGPAERTMRRIDKNLSHQRQHEQNKVQPERGGR